MAKYLITNPVVLEDETIDEYVHALIQGKNVKQAVETLDLEPNTNYNVYTVVGSVRQVVLSERTITDLRIKKHS
jgi:hypothetical protein